MAVCRGRWSLPGGGEGAPTWQCHPPGPGLRSRPCPDATRRSASVTWAAGRVVRRDPEAAAGARSAVPPHGQWVSWVSGLGVQKTRRAVEAHMRCGLETHVQGRRSHWTLLRSLSTGDGHASASSTSAPGLPGGHSWTHTPWVPRPRALRASAGRAGGWERSLYQPPGPACPRLCCKSAVRVLQTGLQETGAASPVLMVCCGISMRPLSALF